MTRFFPLAVYKITLEQRNAIWKFALGTYAVDKKYVYHTAAEVYKYNKYTQVLYKFDARGIFK